MNRLLVVVWFIFGLLGFARSQNAVLAGRLLEDPASPLAGVNIYLEGTVLGAASDDNGLFVIRGVPFGQYRLRFSMIGYANYDTLIQVAQTLIDIGSVTLRPVALQASPIVVTAGKYDQYIQDVPMSVSTVSAREINFRNSVSIDDALKYVSGITMNADQVNIRGSNGYSYGVGSRVMMLIDGIPYITGDTQGLIYNALPMNRIERLEILKGAGSSLYGSNAIGGVINVITKPVSEQAEMNLKLYGGWYDDPHYDQWKWSDQSRFKNGIRVDYGQRFDRIGLRLDFSRDEDDSYRKNDWSMRYNAGGKLEFDPSPFDRITVSGNFMDTKRENFLYWKNLTFALEPDDDQLGERVHTQRYFISSIYRRIFGEREFLKANVIWYKNRFDDDVGGGEGNHSRSDFLNLEVQYNHQFGVHYLVSGITPSYSKVASNLFGDREGYNFAVYLQDEVKFSDLVAATLGARLDYFNIDELGSDQRVNPKFGMTYKPYDDTVLRFSAGTGFRAPSMAEAFTSTAAGGLIVEPNPDLKAERSFSGEIGWNQLLEWQMYFQLALFYNYYWDLIEGGFQKTTGNIRFENITEARVYGLEINHNWKVIGETLTFNTGYTYVNASELDTLTGKFDQYLKYRPRHVLYLTAKSAVFGFELGLDYRYMSRFDAIDETFALIIPDAEERVAAHLVDLRIARRIDLDLLTLELSLQVNNLLQYNYVDVIGTIAPIRNYILTLETVY